MMSTLNICLVRPPVDVLHKFSKPVECLALGYLASAARAAGHDVTLVDGMLFDWSIEVTVELILETRPRLICITIVLNHFPDSVTELCRQLRAADFDGPILVGGHAVSFFPERILSSVAVIDGVVCGEGEESLPAIADNLARGKDWWRVPGVVARINGDIIRNRPVRISDLDALAFPARDLGEGLLEQDGLFAISTSRGCYARCTFCSVPRFYGLEKGGKYSSGAWLARNPESIVSEVSKLYDQFKLRELLIVDDEFFGGTTLGQARAIAFADQIAALQLPTRFALSCRAENVEPAVFEHLARAGVTHIFIGLESGVDADLKLLGKGHTAAQNKLAVEIVKGLGMSFQAGFMLFNHRSTLASVRTSLIFLREIGECKPTTINSSVDPHFGAPLTDLIGRDGALIDGGLQMSSVCLDPAVETLRHVAASISNRFGAILNAIAGLQSSVTFEWRRKVPGRPDSVCAALDAFEAETNASFTDLLFKALEALEAFRGNDAAAFLAEFEQEIGTVERHMKTKLGLLSLALSAGGERPRYWTQRDLIAANAPPANVVPRTRHHGASVTSRSGSEPWSD